MIDNGEFFPEISPLFGMPSGHSNNSLYHDMIPNVLKKILPAGFFGGLSEDDEHLKERIQEQLPFLTSSQSAEDPSIMSFYVLSRLRANSFAFFFEMISHWLVPGKRLNVLLIYAIDFKFPKISSNAYTLCEVMIKVQNKEELEQIQRNLPILEMEIRLGMESSYYARRILEVKGLSPDEKTAMIQEYIAYLAKRLPKFFDQDVMTEMQHVLVMCRDDFKTARNFKHLSRIISVHYLFRKGIKDALKVAPTHRHVAVKFFRSTIKLPIGQKRVLAVMVGVNFLKDKEVFEQKHLLNAIQNYIPTAKAVEHSFFANKRGSESICTLYLEVEKENGQEFTSKEIAILRQELQFDLKDSIEHLMHPVFMPRNEEEIMRNILSLSNQIKFLRDIPQVYITFDEQTHTNLFFTVILVRVLKPGQHSIQELFKEKGAQLSYIHDRCKNVGFLRKKYPKEATVFRVKLPKEQFLRRDHSINLYEARQAVVFELLRVVGEFRDYNGGMISKQNEVLSAVKKLLGDDLKYNDILMENFFYSLSPVIMRTFLEPEAFTALFNMLVNALDLTIGSDDNSTIDFHQEPNYVCALVITSHRQVKEELHRSISKLHLHSSELANAYVQIYDNHYCGYIYRCDDSSKQQIFKQTIQNAVSNSSQKALLKPVA